MNYIYSYSFTDKFFNMKKIYILLLCVMTSAYANAQNDELPQLSARTKKFMSEVEALRDKQQLPEGYAYRKLADGDYYASALIKVKNASLAERNLNTLNAKIGTKAGDIWTVQVPVTNLHRFAQTKGIQYIEVDQPVFPQLDAARKKTKVDSVHNGYNLPMRYSGKDVVMGVIDFGFDYDNPAFYDTSRSMYRIKKVWELGTNGTPPAGYSYGHEITDTTLIKAQGTDNSHQMHGTPVTGIAAGSGYGSKLADNTYRGVAYESDLVFVGVRRDTLGNQWMQGTFTDFVDGINYIFTHAANVGKPAVVNISWGSQSGAHDGTSLFNQACNNLSGQGKIIVMSAGNDGNDKIHLQKTFTSADTLVSSFITFSDTVYQRTWIDAWGEPTKDFCVAVTLYGNGAAGNSTGFLCADNNSHNLYLLSGNGLDTCYVDISTSSSEINNGKPHIFLNVYNKSTDSMGISFKADNGTINAWNESYFYGYVHSYSSQFESLGMPGAVDGDTLYATSEMGAADSVLLIGAYTTRSGWTNINNQNYGYLDERNDRIATFSSWGPMADGRIKPDIVAPGVGVISPMTIYDTSYTNTGTGSPGVVSSYTDPVSGKTYYFTVFGGTSAAAPAASGIIALLLQVKSLYPGEVKDLLFETAIKDVYTGAIPASGNITWGHGKINAYDAIKKLIVATGVYEYSGKKLDAVLYPNPSNGVFQLEYTGSKNETLAMNVVDMKGSIVASDIWKVNQGYNQRTLNLSSLSKGAYFLKVTSASGSVTIKTVIQ